MMLRLLESVDDLKWYKNRRQKEKLFSMVRLLPISTMLATALCLAIAGQAATAPLWVTSEATDVRVLPTPEVIISPSNTFQTTIGLEFYNTFDYSIEVYRSRNASSGFQLIATLPPGTEDFSDQNLKPRTPFYYRVRTASNSDYSAYVSLSHTTESEYYDAGFLVRPNDGGYAVEITITDKSYQDRAYHVERSDGGYSGAVTLSDSGRSATISDFNIEPLTSYTYTLIAVLNDEGMPYWEQTSVTITTPLEVPQFGITGGTYTDQTDIVFFVENRNPESTSEIWRSLSPTSGFTLVGTLPSSEEKFTDPNLKPRTSYFYKLRATKLNNYSAYSEVQEERTFSNNYPPTFTARALDENTIELSLKDNSYNDLAYTIVGTSVGNDFYEDVYHETDSGSTRIIIHEPVNPGTFYSYRVDMTYYAEGIPTQQGIATASVTTPGAPACNGGHIIREVWTNVPGINTTDIPLHRWPDTQRVLTSFESPSNEGSDYGARVRGYVCVPLTGDYTFWIASDDKSELYLSTNTTAGAKVKIASVTGHTSVRQWDKYVTQKSAPIHLEAGNRYYIEALHKEGSGQDHLAVGWQLPNGAFERPIPGNRLIEFEPYATTPPTVMFNSPKNGDQFNAPATVNFDVTALDQDGQVVRVAFYHNGNKIGEDISEPFTFRWENVQEGEYVVYAYATDNAGQSGGNSVSISVSNTTCSGSGGIQREIWRDITGTSVNDIPVNTPAPSRNFYGEFNSGPYEGTNYGSRWRAYVCVPQTGNYRFFIASDDQSQLFLSTDETVANKRMIAYVNGHTNYQEYTRYASQTSALIPLVAGQRYYIEALHKEATGNDHLTVGWQMPDGTLERPLGHPRLRVFNSEQYQVYFTTPEDQQVFDGPASIPVQIGTNAPAGTFDRVELWVNSVKYGEDLTAPYEFTLNDMNPGTYKLEAIGRIGTDYSAAPWINITVNESNCTASGTINREVWNGIGGTDISSIPVNSAPSSVSPLTIFETPNYSGNDYGARVRGYVCVPQTGNYTFWIASDDSGELWLSSDEDPQNKSRIAYVSGHTRVREWTKYPTQRSVAISLVAGRRYYIEALHKEANGADHLAVGWQMPDATLEQPIPGSRLIPFENSSTQIANANFAAEIEISTEQSNEIEIFPNPTHNRNATLIIRSDGVQDWNGSDVNVTSITGESVFGGKLQCDGQCREMTIQLNESTAAGVYIVSVTNGRLRLVKKLMVR
jgi:hypothetical protein